MRYELHIISMLFYYIDFSPGEKQGCQKSVVHRTVVTACICICYHILRILYEIYIYMLIYLFYTCFSYFNCNLHLYVTMTNMSVA